MTFYYSRELSQKLQDMGCRSNNGFRYGWKEGSEVVEVIHESFMDCNFGYPKTTCIAFSPYDFCGPSEQCQKNADMRWPGNEVYCNRVNEATYHRHAMIDLPEEEQEAYMWKGMKGGDLKCGF